MRQTKKNGYTLFFCAYFELKLSLSQDVSNFSIYYHHFCERLRISLIVCKKMFREDCTLELLASLLIKDCRCSKCRIARNIVCYPGKATSMFVEISVCGSRVTLTCFAGTKWLLLKAIICCWKKGFGRICHPFLMRSGITFGFAAFHALYEIVHALSLNSNWRHPCLFYAQW